VLFFTLFLAIFRICPSSIYLGRAFLYLVLAISDLSSQYCALDVQLFTLLLAISGFYWQYCCISLLCSSLYFRSVLVVLCFGRAFLYLVPCYFSFVLAVFTLDVHFFTLFLAIFQFCPSSIYLGRAFLYLVPCYFRSVLAVLCFGCATLYLVTCYNFGFLLAVLLYFVTMFLTIFQICPHSIVLWTCLSLPCSLLYFRFVLAC
jgi:hypothetical protein